MKPCRVTVVPVVGLALVAGSLLAGVDAAGAATQPPPVIVHSPHSKRLAVGQSFTFKASARGASLVLWVVRSPDGSSFHTYSGTNTTTKRGVLRSSYTFGPFVASENGWEVGAAFINDPTGVPSGIQESNTSPAIVTLKG